MPHKTIIVEQKEGLPAGEFLYIKHMVCSICIRIVREKLASKALPVREVKLGRVWLERALEPAELDEVAMLLQEEGFELIITNKFKIIEQIKKLIGKTIYPNGSAKNLKYSEYLAKCIGRDYSFLSHTFSTLENITIEKYIIYQKTERAKELLNNPNLALNHIANLLAYSSVGHFSKQFKNVTGISPSEYRKSQVKVNECTE